MVIIIHGASHVGKTLLAQKILEKLNYPYLSLDHLKMGLYKSGKFNFTPMSRYSDITNEIWVVVEEIIKTNIENKQNIIIEGCFIPDNFQDYFGNEYLCNIKYVCLVLSQDYITNHFNDICKYGNIIENRIDNNVEFELIKKCNANHLNNCINRELYYYLVNDLYDIKDITSKVLKYINKK